MAEYTKYIKTLTSPWCPVFGNPYWQNSPGYTPLGEIGQIIDEARGLADIAGYYTIVDGNWPTVNELEKSRAARSIEVYRIIAMRDFFVSYSCVAQYSATTEIGTAIEGRPIHLFWEDALSVARNVCGRYPECLTGCPEDNYPYSSKQFPDHQILAVLAISAAHYIAKGLVIHDEIPNLSVAYGLLKIARERYDFDCYTSVVEDLDNLQDDFSELEPFATAKKKNLEISKEVGEQKKQSSALWHSIVINWYDQIKQESVKGLGNQQIAKEIHKGISNGSFPVSEIEQLEEGYSLVRKGNDRFPKESSINKVLCLKRPIRGKKPK